MAANDNWHIHAGRQCSAPVCGPVAGFVPAVAPVIRRRSTAESLRYLAAALRDSQPVEAVSLALEALAAGLED